jgi:hypothetical protein
MFIENVAEFADPLGFLFRDEGTFSSRLLLVATSKSGWEELGAGLASGGGISSNSMHSLGPSLAVAPNATPYVAKGCSVLWIFR